MSRISSVGAVRAGLATILSVLAVTTSQAALQDQGNGLVFDDVLKVSWSKDANLFVTQLTENPGMVDEIIALTPSFEVPGLGVYNQTANDFRTQRDDGGAAGSMTWYGAQAWVKWLNSKSYAGRTDWRLPQALPSTGDTYRYGDQFTTFTCNGLSDFGYSITSPKSELSYHYYVNLDNKAGAQLNGDACEFLAGGTGPLKVGPFINLNKGGLWTGSDYGSEPERSIEAWTVSFVDGQQGRSEKGIKSSLAWPVAGDGSGGGPIAGGSCSAPTITGTEGDDVLVGTDGPDVISGLGGNDTIEGLGGDDLLCGGAGNDVIRGGPGKDKIVGGSGRDRMFGQGGRDSLSGGSGRDKAVGGTGVDTCIAESLRSCEQ